MYQRITPATLILGLAICPLAAQSPSASLPENVTETGIQPIQPSPAGTPEPEVESSITTSLSDPPPSSALFANAEDEEALPPDFSQSVTINLLKALVEEGVLKKDKAAALLQQAESEALAARRLDKRRKAEAAAEEEESMKVSYVPDAVRTQIKNEVRTDLLKELKEDKSFALLNMPHIDKDTIFNGDLRLRYEYISYPEDNDISGAFPIFNSINTGQPFDTAGTNFSPQLNTAENRQRFRTRVRMGANIKLDDDWMVGLRLGTGNNNSPVSGNQTLGQAGGGQGGNFSKYAIWLDRAFVRYEKAWGDTGVSWHLGRFDNPYHSSPIIFDDELGFDGTAIKVKSKASYGIKPYATLGAFPIFNTELNFPDNQPNKFESIDKYLYGAQLGADFNLGKKVSAKLSGAYYNFDNVQGKASTPYIPLSATDAGDTDNSRPSFAQKGNTYRPLRTIIPDALNNFGTTNQFQYFGLASEFKPITISGKVDVDVFEPVRLSFLGEYIKNTGFNERDIEAVAVNNRGALPVDATTGKASGLGAFEGSDTAWLLGMQVGHAALQKRGDWQVGLDYRWIGSDAVIDGFNDSSFGGGGTNVKGVRLSSRLALNKHANMRLSWMSSTQIAGPPLKSDYIQLDFQVNF